MIIMWEFHDKFSFKSSYEIEVSDALNICTRYSDS